MVSARSFRAGFSALVVVFALVGCGSGDDGSTATADAELVLATRLVDELVADWQASDPEAVAEVFTADAVVDGDVGHEAIKANVEVEASWATDERRTDDLVRTGPGIYVAPLAYD